VDGTAHDREAPPGRARGTLWRALLGGVLIALSTAGALTASVILELGDILGRLPDGVHVPEITRPEAGEAQTIMVLGSDVRYEDRRSGKPPRSDTILLLRLDPDADAVAVTSIPRDLLVAVPGVGDRVRINTAYEESGERGAVRAVTRLLSTPGRRFEVNHVITADFGGFRRAVDHVGCVYADIDRDYFNDHTGPGGYAAIDIDPGYQKLCGRDALDYVRYRHEDNDLVRAARQQEFLRQLRSAPGTRALVDRGLAPGNLEELAGVFGRYFSHDDTLNSTKEVFKLAKTALYTAGKPVREVPFGVSAAPDGVNLVASPGQLRRTVDAFLGAGHAAPAAAGEDDDREGGGRRPRPAQLEPARTAGENQAIAGAREIGFPLLFPTRQTPGAVIQGTAPRTYRIRDPGGRRHDAYRIVVKKALGVGEYYGVQGTTWRDPPILAGAHETVRRGGRRLLVYRDGRRIRLVARRTPRAVYWVANTLTRSLSDAEMLAVAGSLRRLG
jgi:LCP family protein required for cell wall assembly